MKKIVFHIEIIIHLSMKKIAKIDEIRTVETELKISKNVF